MGKLLRFDFIPASTDAALLCLRLWYGLALFINHGWDKLKKFDELSSTFADPLGVGPTASLVLALIGEVLCSVLLVLGLFTRFAALGLIVNMGVAFFLVHGGRLTGERNGELAFAYLGAFVALFLAGGGRFALDHEARVSGAAKKA